MRNQSDSFSGRAGAALDVFVLACSTTSSTRCFAPSFNAYESDASATYPYFFETDLVPKAGED